MNKYAKSTPSSHNGTINGRHSQKRSRREREEARQQLRDENPKTPAQRIKELDKLSLTATRERKRLLKKI